MRDTTAMPLTQQVRECVDAGLTVIEGAAYVKMYDDGYRTIVNLIQVSQQNPDPDIRVRAIEYLTEIDKSGGIGQRFRDITRFVLSHRSPRHSSVHRKKAVRGWRNLRNNEKERLEALTTRADVSEEDQSLAKRLLANITEDKLVSRDYNQMEKLIITYGKSGKLNGSRRHRSKDGWRSLDAKKNTDVRKQLDELVKRSDVTEEDKRKAEFFLSSIEDDRMPSINYIDATRLIINNRASKKERAKRAIKSDNFDNAVFMACQACDNLTDIIIPVMPLKDKIRLAARISGSATNLLRLQTELIQENKDD